ncbi:MAG: lipoyl(octanoyl) transferase LipB [Gammaproteobacteria bacterium]|nr:MAG: lipoyl(octanoyl) transferase LipB [Gammaproteobacteria bacterium]
MADLNNAVVIRKLGIMDYSQAWSDMKDFNRQRTNQTRDEIWLLQHPPVFTQGLNFRPEHQPAELNHIPVIHSDRGGDITYHGPGQLISYLLIDIRRKNLGIKDLVGAMEKSIVKLLDGYQIKGEQAPGAPGIYIAGKKIASLGLRVRRGCSYHGLSINIDMDLTPFSAIPPCGFNKLKMTQLSDYIDHPDLSQIEGELVTQLAAQLGYNSIENEHREISEQSSR